jgi:pimeloyl-ACP methyl ester carboxylesterase
MLLTYDDEGPGPVVVLLHGFPLDRTIWSAQMTSIGSIYRVIAPDLRGFGRTAAPETGYTMETMAGDVVELLDALQIKEPIALGGLSMGGYIALALIARYPERVRALMLMDTRASTDTPEAAQNREILAKQVETSGDTKPVVDAMLPKFFSEMTRSNRSELIPPVQVSMARASSRAVAGALRGMAARRDWTSELSRITVPTLVLGGAHDVITPPDEMRKLAGALPHARYVVIPEAGHLAPLENSGVANEAILAFLNGLP